MYSISNGDTKYADNFPFLFNISYQVTLISRDPDDQARNKIAKLQMSRYDRSYKSDDLNHDVFRIYI